MSYGACTPQSSPEITAKAMKIRPTPPLWHDTRSSSGSSPPFASTGSAPRRAAERLRPARMAPRLRRRPRAPAQLGRRLRLTPRPRPRNPTNLMARRRLRARDRRSANPRSCRRLPHLRRRGRRPPPGHGGRLHRFLRRTGRVAIQALSGRQTFIVRCQGPAWPDRLCASGTRSAIRQRDRWQRESQGSRALDRTIRWRQSRAAQSVGTSRRPGPGRVRARVAARHRRTSLAGIASPWRVRTALDPLGAQSRSSTRSRCRGPCPRPHDHVAVVVDNGYP